MKPVIFPIAALVVLAACETPTPLSVDNTDFNQAVLDNKAASRFETTPVNDIPEGSATYDGAFTSSARVNDMSGFQMIGDVSMTADFGANNTVPVRGEITDISLIDRDSERDLGQDLGGDLRIRGDAGLGDVVADATGELSWVPSDIGIRETSDVNLRLNGNVRSSSASNPGDTIHGTVDGIGSGEFDLDLTGDGQFTVRN